MSDYKVKYGFGKDWDRLEKDYYNNASKSDDSNYIRTCACFYDYFSERKENKGSDSDVLYTLSCNPTPLKKLIKELNKRGKGFKITLQECVNFGGYFSYTYKKGVKEYIDLDMTGYGYFQEVTDDKYFNSIIETKKIKGYPVSKCTIRIHIDTQNLHAKTMLESILLITIRMLDTNENYWKKINHREKDLLAEINRVSIDVQDGHCMYDLPYRPEKIGKDARKEHDALTIEELEYAFNLDNVLKASLNSSRHMKQTAIFNLILERSRHNDYVSPIFWKK